MINRIGVGNFSEIYKCRDKKTDKHKETQEHNNKTVAMKETREKESLNM